MKKILVTGGAGFVGSHLVDTLINSGNQVYVIDDLSSGSADNINPKAEFFQVDITSAKAADIIKQISPEIIVHAAAQMSVSQSMKDPVNDVNINLLGLLNILSALDVKNLPYFVFISTGGAIYGEQDVFPAPETHAIRPTSVYGQSKYASELYLGLWQRVYGLKYSVLRLANVYGPRQNPHGEAGVVAIFCKKLLSGEVPTIYGTGEFTRDYIYVADVVFAITALINKSILGVFNIGTGVETSVNKLYDKLINAAGLDIQAAYGVQRAGDQTRSVIDASKAQTELKWSPQTDITQGIRETWEWFKNNK
jgi:UDP-glucose 4-epimerase